MLGALRMLQSGGLQPTVNRFHSSKHIIGQGVFCGLLLIASVADTSMAEGCSSSASAEEEWLCCSCRCSEPGLLQDRASALPLPLTSSCT